MNKNELRKTNKLTFRNNKPLLWYYHKIFCEIGWFIRNKINYSVGEKIYYKHLHIMCDKYKFNLYGNKI